MGFRANENERRCYAGSVVNPAFLAPRVRKMALLVSSIALAVAGCGHRALRSGNDAAAPDGAPAEAVPEAPAPQDSPSNPDTSPDLPAKSVADTGSPDLCEPVGCSRTGTDYCGVICDGCGGMLTCPLACGPGRACDLERGVCASSACIPTSSCVTSEGRRYCGIIGNGCGGMLRCGDCPEGESCKEGICSGPSTCNRLTCTPIPSVQTLRHCGTVDDCCGGILDCGSCGAGMECLGHVCDATRFASCTSLQCQMDGYTYCGSIGDACGRELACPAECPEGWTCRNHVCVGLPGHCSPVACEAIGRHRFCGTIGDGCGGTLECGDCPAGEMCTVTHNCQPSPCDGCTPADPKPPAVPLPAPFLPLRYQCPVPAPVTDPITLPPACGQN
jgi:hypothetical protein